MWRRCKTFQVTFASDGVFASTRLLDASLFPGCWRVAAVSAAEPLQQKACAALTRLCHSYALKCQRSHKGKIGRRGPSASGSNTSAGNFPDKRSAWFSVSPNTGFPAF